MKTTWNLFFEETNKRLALNPTKLCDFGIQLLDDYFFKIGNDDLIVIGADSGVGKSEIALSIARSNAQNGKKVLLFHLEGGHDPAVKRLKWKDICEEYYNNREHGDKIIEMDFKKWKMNQCDPLIHNIEAKVWNKYKEIYKENLTIQEITGEFNCEDFQSALLNFCIIAPIEEDGIITQLTSFDIDLIIIDHLQYFSLPEGEHEIASITKILREVKRIVQNQNIPVILISHLRKKEKDRGLPDQEDFYGSSNIPKISTGAITISRAYGKEDLKNNIFPTFFRIVKPNDISNYGLLVNFDAKTRNYSKNYEIFPMKNGMPKDQALTTIQHPNWAKNAVCNKEQKEKIGRNSYNVG